MLYLTYQRKGATESQKVFKMETKRTVVKSGTSLSTLLTVAFVVLKLCKVITWSWVWVLSPIWISWGIALVVIVIVLLIALLLK